jgi:hypothetical protein
MQTVRRFAPWRPGQTLPGKRKTLLGGIKSDGNKNQERKKRLQLEYSWSFFPTNFVSFFEGLFISVSAQLDCANKFVQSQLATYVLEPLPSVVISCI